MRGWRHRTIRFRNARRSGRTARFAFVALAAAILVTACGPSDPYTAALEERAAWKVELESIVEGVDGRTVAGFRITSPVRKELDRITVHLVGKAADGTTTFERWQTFTVPELVAGQTATKQIEVPASDPRTEGIEFDRVLAPTPEQRGSIPELASIPLPATE